jgi:PilZ domain-containing protein
MRSLEGVLTLTSGFRPGVRKYVRRSSRHAIDKRIRVIVPGSGLALSGRCTSLSQAGFGAVLAGKLPELEMVTIEFDHSAIAQRLRLIARVRHFQGFHYGFEFVAPDSQQRAALAELFSEDASPIS